MWNEIKKEREKKQKKNKNSAKEKERVKNFACLISIG